MTDEDEPADVPIYRAADWPGTWKVGMTGGIRSSGPDGRPGPLIIDHCSVDHVDEHDPRRSLTVTSQRSHDVVTMREWALRNMARAAAEDELGQDAGPKGLNRKIAFLTAAIAAGTIPWVRTAIAVDDTEVAFDMASVGSCWTAVGVIGEVFVTLDGRHVPVARLGLCRLSELPTRHEPPAGFWMPPKPRARAFPASAMTADTRTEAFPDHARVDLVYRNRTTLSGTFAGKPVDISLNAPYESTAVGSIGGAEVRLEWLLGSNATTHPDVPAHLHGTLLGQPVELEASFHLDPNYAFEHADISGNISGQLLQAHVEAVAGGLTPEGTVVIEGIFGPDAFSVFATIASGHRAVVHGTVSDRPVHLDARVGIGPSVRITGHYDGPGALLVVIAGSVVNFL